MNRTSAVLGAMVMLLAIYLVPRGRHSAPPVKTSTAIAINSPPHRIAAPPPTLAPREITMPPPRPIEVVTPAPASGQRRRAPPNPVLRFTMQDGVAVTLGDVVMGVPSDANAARATLTPLEPWRGPEVAFHIQPDLPDPDRVRQGLTLFEGTPIRFVEYTDQADVLVFEPGTGDCKSYVGRIGGKQPIWLSPACGPVEVAHEIMHALGFVHEQNRDDRDAFVRVLLDNVEPGQEVNFAKLPGAFMRLSQLAPFDYRSVMIYPKRLFGVGGRDTLESARPGVDIEPTRGLSDGDRDRLRAAFGR